MKVNKKIPFIEEQGLTLIYKGILLTLNALLYHKHQYKVNKKLYILTNVQLLPSTLL